MLRVSFDRPTGRNASKLLRRPSSSSVNAGSETPSASAHARSSKTSRRRAPRSTLLTSVCMKPIASAKAVWVIPRAARVSRSKSHRTSCGVAFGIRGMRHRWVSRDDEVDLGIVEIELFFAALWQRLDLNLPHLGILPRIWNMETLTLHNGQQVRLTTFTGEVVEAGKSNSVEIHQGDALVLSKDVVVPGRISSTTHVTSEVWLRQSDGLERSFKLKNVGVPVRLGHRLSVVSAAPAQESRDWLIGSRNHSTREMKVSLLSALGDNASRFKLDAGGNLQLLGLFLAFPVVGAILCLIFSSNTPHVEDRLMIGALLGVVASIVLGIRVIQFVAAPRVRRAVQEIETMAGEKLASLD